MMTAAARPTHYGYGRPLLDLPQLLGGFGAIGLVVGSVALFAAIYGAVTGHSILDPRAIGAEPPPLEEADEPEIVEAGFVQLGRAWDPRELPDRRISSAAQAPRAQDPNVVSPFQRLLQDAGVPPPNRALTALLETSASYDQDGTAQLLFEQEGEAWGAERARDGNMLYGQLHSLIQRGLEVPPNLPESEFARTVARVQVVVDADWTVTSIQLVGESGDADWDRAVRRRVEEIASARPRLTPSPGDESYLNRTIPVRVHPRASRRRTGGGSGSTALDRLLQ